MKKQDLQIVFIDFLREISWFFPTHNKSKMNKHDLRVHRFVLNKSQLHETGWPKQWKIQSQKHPMFGCASFLIGSTDVYCESVYVLPSGYD